MKFNLSKKIVFEVGALIVIGLIAVFMTSANTNLFKGDVSNTGASACQAQQTSYDELYDSVKDDLDAVQALNVSNNNLPGYQDRENEIAEIGAYLDEHETFNCQEDMTAIVTELRTLQDVDIAAIELEINSALGSTPSCPLNNESDNRHKDFTDFLLIHEIIEDGILDLNSKRVWDEDDYELLKDMVWSMRVLDLSELTGNLPATQLAEIEANLEDLDINFANRTIQAYNSEIVVGTVQALDCEGVEVLAQLSSPTQCAAGTRFSESSGVCVAVSAQSVSTCEFRDLYEDIDSIYEILEDSENDPGDFGDDESALIAALLSGFPSDLNDGLTDYISEIDYENDANDIIEELNFIILDTQDESCSKNLLSSLDIEDAEYTCPVGATHTVVNSVDVCTCNSNSRIVESNGTCETQANNTTNVDAETDDEEDFELFLCLDGETEVEDPMDCPDFDDEVVEEVDDDEFFSPEFYASANTLNVNQGSNISLTTNTNPNIMTSPIVQGDTGPGAITAFLLFLSVLGGGLLKSLSII